MLQSPRDVRGVALNLLTAFEPQGHLRVLVLPVCCPIRILGKINVKTFRILCIIIVGGAEELDRERNPSMYGPPPCRWPSAIDWKVFIGRAFSLGDKLQSIVDDIDERWQDSFSSRKSLRSFQEEPQQLLVHPRTESYFWKTITNDILVHGRKYPELPDGTLVILSRARPG